jgi:hypothetical protein
LENTMSALYTWTPFDRLPHHETLTVGGAVRLVEEWTQIYEWWLRYPSYAYGDALRSRALILTSSPGFRGFEAFAKAVLGKKGVDLEAAREFRARLADCIREDPDSILLTDAVERLAKCPAELARRGFEKIGVRELERLINQSHGSTKKVIRSAQNMGLISECVNTDSGLWVKWIKKPDSDTLEHATKKRGRPRN